MREAGHAYRIEDQVCLYAGAGHDFEDPSSRKWRVDIAGRHDSAASFQNDSVRIIHEKGAERSAAPLPIPPDAVAIAEYHTPEQLAALIDRENENSRELLVAQLRSPMGVVPFVGAGLSVDFGFPGWPKFLTDAAEFHSDPAKVLALIKANRLIEAATILAESPDRFQLLVENCFGRQVSEEQARSGAVSYLPRLACGPVITTNFDRVLEAAFRAAGAPFEDFITGDQPDKVIRAMHRNKHVLIKIHGDALDRSARVFTGKEYEAHYGKTPEAAGNGEAAKPAELAAGGATISKLALVMFTNRPLLFLGSSLDKDKTLEVLEKIHQELPGLTHYAVLAASYGVADLRKRRRELDGVGISPLWYLPGDFKSIERILGELIQEASTRLIWKPKRQDAEARSSAPLPVAAPAAEAPAAQEVLRIEKKHALLARRLARRIVNGRLAFFVGAGAHVRRELSARAFYRSIAEEYAFKESELQRAEAAQLIVDCEGKADAWISAKERLPDDESQASVVYRFLAELPSLLRSAGKKDAGVLWMLTTNYDLMLEKLFDRAPEPFHLLYYQVDGKDAGSFLHREPDGSIRVIERPANATSFHDGAHVIVKLDGGIPYDPHFNETVAISPMDFAISAGRLRTALPEAVQSVLRDRSLLILGSSLKDPHVQSLVRWSSGTTRVTKTWAVSLQWSETQNRFWSVAGVELVDCDFEEFIPALRSEVLRSLGLGTAAQAAG